MTQAAWVCMGGVLHHKGSPAPGLVLGRMLAEHTQTVGAVDDITSHDIM